ncbi:hypothetical protein [Cellulophaga baltica]|uniref:hypothetical protein n=1 Tax=Cellulophaga baltica TaxID=76594 RepID=UPI0024958937|nr:hypothetical protein [Cellulophaga baltica]
MRTFNPTESDHLIFLKKDKAEIENWIEQLEFINTELEYFTEIEQNTQGQHY